MVEYFGLEPSQQTYAKKALLYSEMELLNSIKHYHNYKKLRKQEGALKSLLKKTILEVQEEFKKLDEMLPETKQDEFESVKISKAKKGGNDLETEIEEIKRKIAKLQ